MARTLAYRSRGAGRMGACFAVLLPLSSCGSEGVFRSADRHFDTLEDIEAVDGATVRIEGEFYRLVGIDAPKLAPDAKCWAEAILARTSQNALALELMSPVEIVSSEGDPPDTVRLFADGRFVSGIMVEKGLAASTEEAWDWCGAPNFSDPAAPRFAKRSPGATSTLPSPGRKGG